MPWRKPPTGPITTLTMEKTQIHSMDSSIWSLLIFDFCIIYGQNFYSRHVLLQGICSASFQDPKSLGKGDVKRRLSSKDCLLLLQMTVLFPAPYSNGIQWPLEDLTSFSGLFRYLPMDSTYIHIHTYMQKETDRLRNRDRKEGNKNKS